MNAITINRRERIKMFLNEYYFGLSVIYTVLRLVAGPPMFYLGFLMYSTASDRFGIGYGGFIIVFSIYYTFKPFLWILVKWKSFDTIHFELEAGPEKIIIREDRTESQIEYSKFVKLLRKTSYFTLWINKELKIYLPIDQLSHETIETLDQNIKN